MNATPTAADDDWVALLGAKGGPAIRPGSATPTASLLRLGGRTVLVDCGLGAALGVVRQGVELTAIDWIVITHLHSDHYLELGPLLHTAWTAGLKRRVDVIGPSGLADYWRRFLASMAFDIALRIEDEGRPNLADLVEIQTLREGEPIELGPLAMSAIRNLHPPIEESFALRFDGAERSVVFSGDTAYAPRMAAFAAQADLLVHEAMLLSGVDALCARVGNGDDRLKRHLLRSHCSAADAGRIASEADAGALALHHLIPSDDPDFTEDHWIEETRRRWSGPLFIGEDGLRIPLARRRGVDASDGL